MGSIQPPAGGVVTGRNSRAWAGALASGLLFWSAIGIGVWWAARYGMP